MLVNVPVVFATVVLQSAARPQKALPQRAQTPNARWWSVMWQRSLSAGGCVLVRQRLTKFPGLFGVELENFLLWIGILFALDCDLVCGPCFENFGISKDLIESR